MKTNTHYQRVIPRDLFNEAKLLKCMGRLCLLIHDRQTPFYGEVHHDGSPFTIGLIDDGSLTITNLKIKMNGRFYEFKTTYNSKRNYPLLIVDGYNECPVFNDSGDFGEEFLEFIKQLN